MVCWLFDSAYRMLATLRSLSANRLDLWSARATEAVKKAGLMNRMRLRPQGPTRAKMSRMWHGVSAMIRKAVMDQDRTTATYSPTTKGQAIDLPPIYVPVVMRAGTCFWSSSPACPNRRGAHREPSDLGRIGRRGLVAQTAVRPAMIVRHPPILRNYLRLRQAREQLAVEEFITQLPVERFVEAVLQAIACPCHPSNHACRNTRASWAFA